MDQELKAYLDTHFAQMGDRIDARLDGVDARLDKMESRLDGMDSRLSGMDSRFDGMDSRLDRLETEVRQTRILVEGQRDDIRQIAEEVIATTERLDQVPSLIALPYQAMDGRVRALESWKERTDRDPVEIVRERWGKPKTT